MIDISKSLALTKIADGGGKRRKKRRKESRLYIHSWRRRARHRGECDNSIEVSYYVKNFFFFFEMPLGIFL